MKTSQLELRVGGDLERLRAARAAASAFLPSGPGKPMPPTPGWVTIGLGQHVGDEQRALAQRLEGGAALGQPRVTPRQQYALALGLVERAEPPQPAAAKPVSSAVSQRPSSRASWRRSAARGFAATAPASASTTPSSLADGTPLSAGKNVSQIEASAARWRGKFHPVPLHWSRRRS